MRETSPSPLRSTNGDSLAQLVEHNTFNVGVLGSSPRRITNKTLKIKQLSDKDSCFFLIFSCNCAHIVKPRVKPKTNMSETVNVVCYKSKTLKDGSHPLMVRVCKDGKKKYQSIGISILPSQWDFKRNEPNDRCPNSDEIKLLIQQRLYEIQKKILSNRIDGKDYTATTIINSVAEQTKSAKSVGEYYLTYIENLKKENRIRYAGMYEVSFNSFIKFAKHLDIPFSDIDVAWLKRYEAWSKEQNLSVSTISTRLRHLRAIFNLAIMEQAIKSECYPFHAYKVSKLSKETAKRALTKDDVHRIMEYEGKSLMECLAIDIFTFSYLCAGINFRLKPKTRCIC